MRLRNRLMGLAGWLAAAGVAAASPPGEPVRPQVDGREPTPIARDYHEPEAVARGFSTVPVFSSKSGDTTDDSNAAGTLVGMSVASEMGMQLPTPSVDPTLPLAHLLNDFRNTMLNYMTVPLGTVRIED